VNDKIIPIGKAQPEPAFHPAVRAGDFIYVSGQVAKDENGNMSSGNIEEETRWTLEGIRRILQLEGADLSDVVKVTVYLDDARNFGRYNKIFAEYFPDGRVSRTTVEARAVIECKIEMDAVAYKRAVEFVEQSHGRGAGENTMLKVLGRGTSGNVQKVIWLLEELGLPYEREIMGASSNNTQTEAYLKLNPNGKVPTLVDGDVVVWESNTILRYLCSKSPAARRCIPRTRRRAARSNVGWTAARLAQRPLPRRFPGKRKRRKKSVRRALPPTRRS